MRLMFWSLAAAAVMTAATAPARAGSVLIINGASGTSEPGTTSAVTTHLTSLLVAAGNTVTVSDGIPASLSGYGQVWDVRFSNNLALSTADRAQYVSYLASGGSMFVMGENSGFGTRNTSVLGLISDAGGGNLSFTTPNSTQTIEPAFRTASPISQVTYQAPGGVGTGAGTGTFITDDTATSGSALAFAHGTLANAAAGALSVIFDVNFMEGPGNVSAGEEALVEDLVGFVQQQASPTPEPATLIMLGTGVVTLVGYRRRMRKQAA
jgi:hypothetical protein